VSAASKAAAIALVALGAVLVYANALPGSTGVRLETTSSPVSTSIVAPVTASGERAATLDVPVITAVPVGDPVHITVRRGSQVFVDVAMTKTTSLLPDGTYEPPIDKASWYAVGSYYADKKPGKNGVSIVGGHISYNGVPGTFYGLLDVRVGDDIIIDYDSGDKVQFKVTQILNVDKSVATDITTPLGKEIWAPQTDTNVIRLFTCDPGTAFIAGHYVGNIVVFGSETEATKTD
jgi:hypothetical protein